MKALLLADRDNGQLAPLTHHACTAMLPVLGKPLVVHAVESLVASGIREIIVATSDRASQIEKELGNGARFGVEISFLLTRGNQGFDAVAARIGSELGDEYLAMHADVLRSSFVGRFLSLASARPGRTLRAMVGGVPCGVWRVARGHEWNVQDVEVDAAYAMPIDSLQAFHRANMEALRGQFPGLLIPGRKMDNGLTIRGQTSIPADLQLSGPVFAGRNCKLKNDVSLADGVVLSDHVVIDSQATLSDCVILPETYVGPMVELQHAIAWKTDLIRVDTGTVVQVADPALLGDLRGRSPLAAVHRLLDRVLGLAFLILSAPLWICMLADSSRTDRKRPLRRVRLLGNRSIVDDNGDAQPREFDVLEGATHVPLLRHLPRLLAVVTGDLALVGVHPVTARTNRTRIEDWQRVRESAPVGLLTPAHLGTPTNAPEEDKLLLEALYAETRNGWSDLFWLGRGLASLFTARAWRLPIRF
jgi:mannose-1-phosphate guanylyltransferase/phosphomannomutase